MSLPELGGSLDKRLDRYEADQFTRIDVELWRRDGIPDEKIWEYRMREDRVLPPRIPSVYQGVEGSTTVLSSERRASRLPPERYRRDRGGRSKFFGLVPLLSLFGSAMLIEAEKNGNLAAGQDRGGSLAWRGSLPARILCRS